MLTCEDLTLSFGSRPVLGDASLSLREGQVLGLVAPDGSGKTTLLKALAGAPLGSARGAVQADGVPGCRTGDYQELVFYAPGDGSLLYGDLNARDHFDLLVSHWGIEDSPAELMERWGVAGLGRKPVFRYSQGMRQQLVLGLAFSSPAKYLLLDEPLNALDPTWSRRALGWVRAAADGGRGVLMSSHLLDTIDAVCDGMVFIKGHELVEVSSGQGAREAYDRLYGAV